MIELALPLSSPSPALYAILSPLPPGSFLFFLVRKIEGSTFRRGWAGLFCRFSPVSGASSGTLKLVLFEAAAAFLRK